MSGVSVLAFDSIRALRLPLPVTLFLPLHKIPAIFAFYAFGALFEKIGWTGYATGPLQRRYGVLGAGLIIGTVRAIWHIVPWWLAKATQSGGCSGRRWRQ
jgi:membrane protease YdiL (CAAX protease family)